MKTPIERLYNGIVKENPTFILMLGMCPTLAVTTSAINGLGMGLATTVVLGYEQYDYFLIKKGNSGRCSYAGIYRYCSFICNNSSNDITGLCYNAL